MSSLKNSTSLRAAVPLRCECEAICMGENDNFERRQIASLSPRKHFGVYPAVSGTRNDVLFSI